VSNLILVVPCYNEELRLDTKQFATYQLAGQQIKFIFVNDGSKDGTLELLNQLKRENPKKLDVLDLPRNSGKAEAVRAGLLAALKENPDFIGFWDADLATPLSEIKHFCEIIGDFPHIDILFGARIKLLGRKVDRKPVRHYLGRIFATVVSLVLKIPIYDTQCGAKLLRADAITRKVLAQPFTAGWIFDVEMLARYENLYAHENVSIEDRLYEVPLMHWKDVQGSKLKPKDFFVSIFNLGRIYLNYFVLKRVW
jgi:dolichyl-phosphate beta-glucosyltransferase